MSTEIEVRGMKEAQAAIERTLEDVTGPPMVAAMRTATMLVQRDAKTNAPVDTGRLRASITPSVADLGDVVQGVVGSNVTYAPYMELGTRPHWPPISALEVWARRHGTEPYLVARAIARRGTKARKFLQRAMESNKTRIFRILNAAIKRIAEGK